MGPHFPIFSFFYLYIIIVNKESAISFSNSFSSADSEFDKSIFICPFMITANQCGGAERRTS